MTAPSLHWQLQNHSNPATIEKLVDHVGTQLADGKDLNHQVGTKTLSAEKRLEECIRNLQQVYL